MSTCGRIPLLSWGKRSILAHELRPGRLFSATLALLSGLACAQTSPTARAPDASTSATTTSSPTLAPLVWVEDSYDTASTQAQREGKLVLVDLWAPWCHTCLSMRSFVLGDPALRAFASQFVWASIDTEQARNASFLRPLDYDGIPTFLVMDPRSQQVVSRWTGSLTVAQMKSFLTEGLMTAAQAQRGASQDTPWLLEVAEGDRAATQGDPAHAAQAYKKALAQAPAGWERRGAVYASLARAVARSDTAACVALGQQQLPSISPSLSWGDFVQATLECVGESAPTKEQLPFVLSAVQWLETLAGKASEPLSADDRGDMLAECADYRTKLSQPELAAADLHLELTLLNAAAAAAKDPLAASTFDGARMTAYLALGQPEDALRLLEASEHALPRDYNAPARIARVYLSTHRPALALAPVERAIALASGPRGLQFRLLKVDALLALGRLPEAQATLQETSSVLHSLMEKGAIRPEHAASLKSALEQRSAALAAAGK